MSEDPTVQFTDGAAYEVLMGRWSRKAGVKFLSWSQIPPGLSWLDVGCGNGAFTEEIISHAAPKAVMGIDPAPAQIDHAKARAAVSSAHFQVGDALNLPVADGQFDVGVMALVIAFLSDPARGVAELKRVVRREGYVATYMWDLPGGGVPLSPFYREMKAMGFPPPMPQSAEISRLAALRDLWQGAGLREVETTVIRIMVHHENFDAFWASNTLPVGPQAERLRALSPAQLAELRHRLHQALPAAPDGGISYESFANAVKGRV
jgi:ubiquinone/menaquinone biosynthesis C-methylase UbiE